MACSRLQPHNRKRLAINLYTDDESQLTALKIIEDKPTRQRADFQRDCLVAGLALSRVDPRLPRMLASALSHEIAISSVEHLLNAIKPIEQTANVTAVAWQKREKNTQSPEQEWLDWCPISESNYNECLKKSSSNIEVRALWARSEQNSLAETSRGTMSTSHLNIESSDKEKSLAPHQSKAPDKSTEVDRSLGIKKQTNNTASSAKTMFLPE